LLIDICSLFPSFRNLRLQIYVLLKTESAVIQTVQEFAAQLSLRSVSFVTCLFPDFNVVSQLQALLFIVPVLLAADIALVRLSKQNSPNQ
jgi:DMSO reductase anchor subunit